MDTLSYKTISLGKNSIEKRWFVADAEGKTLGRFTSEIAKIIRGKNKPGFTPNADCGDHVIVLNAEKIALTGSKMTDKEYQFYSGHPGGKRIVKANDMLAKRPEFWQESEGVDSESAGDESPNRTPNPRPLPALPAVAILCRGSRTHRMEWRGHQHPRLLHARPPG